MTAPLVSIRNLCVELDGNAILKGIDADLARGQITALVGLNGSGKSTLLRALVKEIPISAGRITFHCGHDHRHPAPEYVGYVPQKLHIDAHLPLTVVDLFGLSLQGRRPIFLGIGRRLRARALDLLGQVNAAYLIDELVEPLSGGEKQRILLALALEPHPELLLLDEPAAGIDFQEEGSFYDLLGELNRKTGVTILIVSHDLSAVNRLVHHVLCLAKGRIQCQGPPSEILTGELLSQTFGAGKIAYGHKHAITSEGQLNHRDTEAQRRQKTE